MKKFIIKINVWYDTLPWILNFITYIILLLSVAASFGINFILFAIWTSLLLGIRISYALMKINKIW